MFACLHLSINASTHLQDRPAVGVFQTRISLGGTLAFRMPRYDATRDGKRFLINSERAGSEPVSPPITVGLNWQEPLNR